MGVRLLTMPAGRPTELTEEFLEKYREWVLEGKTLEEIAVLSEIPVDTMQAWKTRNYRGFADKQKLYKLELKLQKAEEFSDKLMQMDDADEKEILKLKQKESEFIRETIGKKIYSKRTEQTGADGVPLQVQLVNYADTVQVPPKKVSD